MRSKSKKTLALCAAMAAVSALHFFTTTDGSAAHALHIFFAKLFYVPIVAAALWFGLPGALAAGVSAAALFALHSRLDWQDVMVQMEQMGELASFLVLAAVAGTLASWERRTRERAHRAAARAERERVGTAVAALTETLVARDPDTGAHSKRVADLAERFAVFLGLSRSEVRSLYLAGLLHDIGKVGIPDDVLLKPGSLTPEEERRIREHPDIGKKILAPIGFEKVVRFIAVHHENVDGSGYPAGLKGDQIPVPGRLLALVDTYDALRSQRAYKDALPEEELRRIMSAMAGKKLDESLLARFWEFLEPSTEVPPCRDSGTNPTFHVS